MRVLFVCLIFFMSMTSAYGSLYTVKRGDSLYKIAKKFRTSIRTIKRLNGLRSSRIRPGQRLIVPGRVKKPKKSVETIHIVKGAAQRELERASLIQDYVLEGSEVQSVINRVDIESQVLSEAISSPLSVDTVDNWNLSILNVPEYRGRFLSFISRVISELKSTPYIFGGGDRKRGLDCSSFTMFIYKKFGVELPRTARGQYAVGVPVNRNDLKVGDLVFFRTYAKFPSHVGIYIGDGKFIHFSSFYHGLSISSLDDKYFKRRYIGARRVLSEKVIKEIAASTDENKIKID